MGLPVPFPPKGGRKIGSNVETVTSISGGKTSAYLAVHYPTDHNWFALVSTTDPSCSFSDSACVDYVQEKTGQEVVGTLEDDLIVYTIMDLEQYMGRSIDVVLGPSFDYVVENLGGWLPNKLHRYCTVEMKLRPLFRHWSKTCDAPVEMHIGFRANEQRRARDHEQTVERRRLVGVQRRRRKRPDGRNRWATRAWQKPTFPLIDHKVFKDRIVEFWRDKPVRFAALNNCVGCFHRNPVLLRQMFDEHPEKMEWFAKQERGRKKGFWADTKYDVIKKHRSQLSLDLSEWEGDCDSGHCGL